MGQEIGQWVGKLTMSWEIQWTLLGVPSWQITLLWEFLHLPHGLSQIPFICPTLATLHPWNPAFYPQSLNWMDESNSSWTLWLLVGVGEYGTMAGDLRKGRRGPFILVLSINQPSQPPFSSSLIEILLTCDTVSLVCTTWWSDTHIYVLQNNYYNRVS